jgi:hypothetical protein
VFEMGYLTWCLPSRSLLNRILHGEARFYQGVLIHYQSYDGDYACSLSRVAMSNGDRTYSSTRVPTSRDAWASVATSYCARH